MNPVTPNHGAAAGGAPPNINTHAREVNHDPDSSWRSTQKPLWDQVMKDTGYEFDKITFADIEGDNVLVVLGMFVDNCLSNPPTKKNNPAPYKKSVLVGAFEAVIRKLKIKFRGEMGGQAHEDSFFSSPDILKLKTRLGDGNKRVLMEDSSEFLTDIFPIDRESKTRTILPRPWDGNPENHAGAESRKRVDLKTIAIALFAKQMFSELLKVLLTFKSIGRGGEVKFVNYKNMFFYELYGTIYNRWFQMKTLFSTPTAWVCDFEYPEMCVFFLLGCFWACENGLKRPDGLGATGSGLWKKAHFMFQDLHAIKDATVASQLGRILKGEIPQALKKYFSVKSLRYGALTWLSWDPSIKWEEALALGGWKTDDNGRWYQAEWLSTTVPPAKALSGYPDARSIPVVPSVEVLFTHQSLDVKERFTHNTWRPFVEGLFPCDLPCFSDPNGELRPLLIVVASVMIMHFETMNTKFGSSHAYCEVMIMNVRKAGIPFVEDSASPTVASVELLCKWSRLVKKDFIDRNAPTEEGLVPLAATRGDAAPLQQTLPALVGTFNFRISRLVSDNCDLKQRLVETNLEIQSLRNNCSTMRSQQASLVEMQDLLVFTNATITRKLVNMENTLLAMQPMLQALLSGTIPAHGPQAPPQLPPPAPAPPAPTAAVPPPLAPAVMPPALPTIVTQGTQAFLPDMEPTTKDDTPRARRRRELQEAAVRRQSQRMEGQAVELPTDLARTVLEESMEVEADPTVVQVRPSVNDALQRHSAKDPGGRMSNRGKVNKIEKIDHVLYKYFQNDEQVKFFSGVYQGKLYLHFKSSIVVSRVFQSRDRRISNVVTKVLKLWDALWTPEERRYICLRVHPGRTQREIMGIGERVKRASFLLKHLSHARKKEYNKLCLTTTTAPHVATQWQGVSNNIGTFDLDPYIPKWDEEDENGNNPRESGKILWDFLNEDVTAEIQAAINEGKRTNSFGNRKK